MNIQGCNESDSVLCALKRHVVLSWLALSLYRNGFQSVSKKMIDGAGEIMEMLRLNLDEGVSSSWHEEGSERGKELIYEVSETREGRYRICFYQADDLHLGDFESLEECRGILRKLGLDECTSARSSNPLAQFSASSPSLEKVVERIEGKTIQEIAIEYKLLSDGYHQIVNEACLARLKSESPSL